MNIIAENRYSTPHAGSRNRSPSPHVRFASSPDRKRAMEPRQGPTGIIRRPTSPIVPNYSSNYAPPFQYPPYLSYSSNELLQSKARFLVDTGAEINVIKLDALDEDQMVNENEAIEITGITQSKISTIGTVNIELMKSKITFHVVHSDFPISTDGILVRECLRQEKVEISF